jgi:hypothetical protein
VAETILTNQPTNHGNDSVPSVDEVYHGAITEHPEFITKDPEVLKQVAAQALARIVELEFVAQQPIVINPETAEDIGTLWIFSGTGSYDAPFKGEDNPRWREESWMGGADRSRMMRATYLARKIAEARSGQSIPKETKIDTKRVQAARELIAEFGPDIVYSGYPIENRNAEAVLERPSTIIPLEKVTIIDGDLKVTADQVKTFRYPDSPRSKDKEVLMVSGATQLAARIPHIINKYKPFVEGSLPYVSPVRTPEGGRRQSALMEARGLLWYIYGAKLADEKPYNYQLLDGPSAVNGQEVV